jgi:non-homologous end joining protein Ku
LGDCAPALQVRQNRGTQYAGIIQRLSLNPAEYQVMQRELIDRQRHEFSPQQTVQKYRTLIEQVVAEKEADTTPAVSRFGKKQGKMPMSFTVRSSAIYFKIQKIRRSLVKKGVNSDILGT